MGSSNFNLQQSINNYISLIQNQGSLTGSDVAELTAHLYDATDALKQHGLSEEEAFTIACKRLGNEEILTDEYSKVNTSVKTNKIWAYLFIGFNLFYAVQSLAFTAIAAFYLLVHKNSGTTNKSAFVVTTFHLLFTVLVWYIVKNKRKISYFIEKQVEANPIRIVCMSFIPFLINAIPVRTFNRTEQAMALRYPVYEFDSSFSEFSFYVAIMSMMAGVLSLVFSISRTETLSLKTLFERPSVLFLLLLGVVTELLAASTRAIRIESISGSALVFGLVYLSASFLISVYNKKSSINRYLLIAMFFGLFMEITVGIDADKSRGDTYYTLYFVTAMLLGSGLGRYLGIRLRDENKLSEPQN
jgi:hypothetical protein